jgi:hypothetical protein
LIAPEIVVAPYDTSTGEVLWGVVPLRNESGTSIPDAMDLSDKIVAAAEEVRGVRCLPLNRTIETMRALNLPAITNVSEARRLATALRVDGILVGSVTAYDPYTPTIGLALALFATTGAPGSSLNARHLELALTEQSQGAGRMTDEPLASISEYLDGKNHQVQLDVRQYAIGRHAEGGAIAWKRYIASMPLFGEFAATFCVSKLMEQEWIRLGRAVAHARRGEREQTMAHSEPRAQDPR